MWHWSWFTILLSGRCWEETKWLATLRSEQFQIHSTFVMLCLPSLFARCFYCAWINIYCFNVDFYFRFACVSIARAVNFRYWPKIALQVCSDFRLKSDRSSTSLLVVKQTTTRECSSTDTRFLLFFTDTKCDRLEQLIFHRLTENARLHQFGLVLSALPITNRATSTNRWTRSNRYFIFIL